MPYKDTQERAAYHHEYYTRNRERLRPGAAQRSADWRRRHHDKYRSYKLKREYGISVDDFNRMLEQQGGVCAICKRLPDSSKQPFDRPRYLDIDHDSETGRVRGLLCNSCNRALGLFKHDANTLAEASLYLGTIKT